MDRKLLVKISLITRKIWGMAIIVSFSNYLGLHIWGDAENWKIMINIIFASAIIACALTLPALITYSKIRFLWRFFGAILVFLICCIFTFNVSSGREVKEYTGECTLQENTRGMDDLIITPDSNTKRLSIRSSEFSALAGKQLDSSHYLCKQEIKVVYVLNKILSIETVP